MPCAYSLVAQRLKRLPPLRETRIRSSGREDPLEKEMAAHSRILAWRIPWMEKPGRLQSTGSQRVGHDWATSLSFLSHEHLLFTSPAGMQGKDTCPQQMSWKRSQNRADCQNAKLGSSVLLIPFFCFLKISQSWNLAEMKIKTTITYQLTPVRMAFVKGSTNNKRWRGCGGKGPLLYWCRHC